MPMFRQGSGGGGGGSTAGHVVVLGQQNTAVTKTDANTNEAALYTLPLTPGQFGANDTLRITVRGKWPNSATNKVLRARLGGLAGAILWTRTETTTASYTAQINITNRGAANAQIGGLNNAGNVYGSSGSTDLLTGTVDTAQAQDLVFTAAWGAAGTGTNSITLESIVVELLKAP